MTIDVQGSDDLLGFPVSPGQSMKRKELHVLANGSQQTGMTTCLNGTAFMLFHDPTKNTKFGYDLWEGWQADGSFWYTGSGKSGDQKLERVNLGLIKAYEAGLPIHFFTASKTITTYIGQFTLGDVPFEWKTARGEDGAERQVIVFHLVPVGNVIEKDQDRNADVFSISTREWEPPAIIAQLSSVRAKERTQIELEEMKLQNRFATFLKSSNIYFTSIAIEIPNKKGSLRPDFFLSDQNWVVEAKPSISREHVRLAVGQVLDYSYLLKMKNFPNEPAILLPSRPSEDLVLFVQSLSIHLIIETTLGEFIFL